MTAALVVLCLSLGARAEEGMADVPGLEAPEADALKPAAPAKGAPFHLSARVEPDPVPFGERFFLVVEITRPSSMKIALPDELPETAAAPRAGEVERQVAPLVEKGVEKSAEEGGEGAKPGAEPGATPTTVRETLRIPYLALDLAELKTPELVLKTGDGEPLEISPLPVNVKDDGVLPEGAASSDEGIPLEEAPGLYVYGVFDPRPLTALGSFLISLLGLFAYRLISTRRRLSLPPAPTAPLVTDTRAAHEVALARLEALLAEGLLARGEVAPFVARLMDEVLRSYLEDRYGIAAGRRTTRELAEELLQRSAPGLDLALTRALLEQADLVKFARAELGAEVAHEMAGRVRALIEATAERAPANDDKAPKSDAKASAGAAEGAPAGGPGKGEGA